jgi:hypothetical protein
MGKAESNWVRQTLLFSFLGGLLLSVISILVSAYPCGTFLQTVPRLLSWNAVSKIGGQEVANRYAFLAFGISAIIHGSLCLLVAAFFTSIATKYGLSAKRVQPAILVLVLVIFAALLFVAWPLRDCL